MRVILLLLLIPNVCMAQLGMPQNSEGKFYYSEIMSVDSTSAQDLYSKAQKHIATIYVSAKDVTQLKDDVAKSILVKGYVDCVINKSLGMTLEAPIYFTYSVQCKDGRYKVEFSDFFFKSQNSFDQTLYPLEKKPMTMSKKAYDRWLDNIHSKMKFLLDSLDKELRKNATW